MPSTILAIETATDVCGAACLVDAHLVAEITLDRPRVHAEFLALLIADTLRYAGRQPREVSAVAVSSGPGSYTGLRIGVSTAKGLAYATGARLVAVPSLEALAAAASPYAEPGDFVLAALNARRDEVYAAAYRVAPEENGPVPVVAAGVFPANALPDLLPPAPGGRLWIVGDGASRLGDVLEASTAFRVRRLDVQTVRPSAGRIARLGAARLAAGLTEDVAAFEPQYLRDFVARERTSIFQRLPQ